MGGEEERRIPRPGQASRQVIVTPSRPAKLLKRSSKSSKSPRELELRRDTILRRLTPGMDESTASLTRSFRVFPDYLFIVFLARSGYELILKREHVSLTKFQTFFLSDSSFFSSLSCSLIFLLRERHKSPWTNTSHEPTIFLRRDTIHVV